MTSSRPTRCAATTQDKRRCKMKFHGEHTLCHHHQPPSPPVTRFWIVITLVAMVPLFV
jgi:hypothetical protein